MGDLFPGIDLKEVDRSSIMPEMEAACAELSFSLLYYFKSLEIWEMMQIRHGFMIVGLPYAEDLCVSNFGKCLAEAQGKGATTRFGAMCTFAC